jgi:hypothetical protein
MNHQKIIFLLCLILKTCPIQHTNFFTPYEFLLDINRLLVENKKCSWQFSLRGEYGFNFRGYPIDTKDLFLQNYNCNTIKSNVAQYLNFYESDFAPFLGNETLSNNGQFSQQFTPYTASTAAQLLMFNGELALQSLTASTEFWITPHLKISYYLPFYNLQMKTLSHTSDQKNKFFENAICTDIYDVYKNYGSLTKPYQVTGLGDSEVLISWQHYFYENRDFISGVFTSLRAGLYLPTGMHKDIYTETFLKLPLGYDSSWGIPFGGSIEIDIGCYGGAGISADCITFFPKLMNRMIKTDMRQTDMLTINQSLSLLNTGFKESFAAYLIGHDLNRTFLTTLAYQYNKQNESDIILCDTTFSNLIAQTADILESWTNHNIILILAGDNTIGHNSIGYQGFIKWGFSGCRSIVCNSVGLQINFLF